MSAGIRAMTWVRGDPTVRLAIPGLIPSALRFRVASKLFTVNNFKSDTVSHLAGACLGLGEARGSLGTPQNREC